MGDNGESDDEDIDLKLFIDAIDFMPSFEISNFYNTQEIAKNWFCVDYST